MISLQQELKSRNLEISQFYSITFTTPSGTHSLPQWHQQRHHQLRCLHQHRQQLCHPRCSKFSHDRLNPYSQHHIHYCDGSSLISTTTATPATAYGTATSSTLPPNQFCRTHYLCHFHSRDTCYCSRDNCSPVTTYLYRSSQQLCFFNPFQLNGSFQMISVLRCPFTGLRYHRTTRQQPWLIQRCC